MRRARRHWRRAGGGFLDYFRLGWIKLIVCSFSPGYHDRDLRVCSLIQSEKSQPLKEIAQSLKQTPNTVSIKSMMATFVFIVIIVNAM